MEQEETGGERFLETRHVRVLTVLAAVALLGLTFYPGTLASPYVTTQESFRYTHQVVPESSALYDDDVDEVVRTEYRFEELSPVAKRFFVRTLEAPDGEYYPTVCDGFVLVCDEYSRDDLPEEFSYGEEQDPEAALVFVEYQGERVLFQTGTISHTGLFGVPARLLMALFTMFPLAGGALAVAARAREERVLRGTVAGVAVVGALGLLAPYLHMYDLVAVRTLGFVLLGGVWLGVLGVGGLGLFRWSLALIDPDPSD